MTLIKCNHCGRLVSDRAKICPHCECNLQENDAKLQDIAEVTTNADYSNDIGGGSPIANIATERQFRQVVNSNNDRVMYEGSSSGISKILIAIVTILIVIAVSAGAILLFRYERSRMTKQLFFEGVTSHSAAIDTCVADTIYCLADSAYVEEKLELKYSNIPDLLRMNIFGQVKKIRLDDYNPNDYHYHPDSWTYEFDTNGMLKTISNDGEEYGKNIGTFYYTEGKIVKRIPIHGEAYHYEYRQVDEHTVNIMQIDSEGKESLAMILYFNDIGNIKEKMILDPQIDPNAYSKYTSLVVKYNYDGIEIEDKYYRGQLTGEKIDSIGNWIERTYESGLVLSRNIEYF